MLLDPTPAAVEVRLRLPNSMLLGCLLSYRCGPASSRNTEGGVVMRSADKGMTWQAQPTNLFTGGGVASTDVGSAHQGPLVPMGDKMYVLYFTEFVTSPVGDEKLEVNSRRSMLQLCEVVLVTGDWLSCNRSAPLSVQAVLIPPADPNPMKKPTKPAPVHIARCSVFDRCVHSRGVLLRFTMLIRLKLIMGVIQYHASRLSPPSYSCHRELRHTAEGIRSRSLLRVTH
jgi:hypothetical protein